MGNEWGNQYADNWNEISEYVKKRDNYTCQLCGVRGRRYGPAEIHAHHIHHKSEGGGDDPSNLVTLCWNCHNSVHDHYIQPMTEKARTHDTPVSARSPQSSTPSWKVSDGPVDDNLQRIAEEIYNSSEQDSTRISSNRPSKSGNTRQNCGAQADRNSINSGDLLAKNLLAIVVLVTLFLIIDAGLLTALLLFTAGIILIVLAISLAVS
ncbi:HNH endonuclease [Natrialbaceae archaeon A-CW1-1]